jgi:hypothetical protein
MSEPFATGGCQCGAVRYALKARPFSADFCHCRMCQRAVGNLFAAYADLEADQVEWTKGRPAIFESSTKAERGFCRDCGTPLSFAYKGQPYLSVTLGSLDDPELVPITRHLGVESKASWLMFSDGLPEKQTGESAAGAEMLEGMVSRQSPEGAA